MIISYFDIFQTSRQIPDFVEPVHTGSTCPRSIGVTPWKFNRSAPKNRHSQKESYSSLPTTTLLGTNISYPIKKAVLKMIFLFPRWDMLVPWRVLFRGKPLNFGGIGRCLRRAVSMNQCQRSWVWSSNLRCLSPEGVENLDDSCGKRHSKTIESCGKVECD